MDLAHWRAMYNVMLLLSLPNIFVPPNSISLVCVDLNINYCLTNLYIYYYYITIYLFSWRRQKFFFAVALCLQPALPILLCTGLGDLIKTLLVQLFNNKYIMNKLYSLKRRLSECTQRFHNHGEIILLIESA